MRWRQTKAESGELRAASGEWRVEKRAAEEKPGKAWRGDDGRYEKRTTEGVNSLELGARKC